MNKQIKCIVCPIGCDIIVDFKDETKEIISFSGNECKKGINFVKEELIMPSRLLTTTIKINSTICGRFPIRSDIYIPKENMQEMIREVKKIKVEVPIKSGQIVADNFMGLGIKILSCLTLDL